MMLTLFLALIAAFIIFLALWVGPFWWQTHVPQPSIVFPYKICNICRDPTLKSKEEESRGVCDACVEFGDGPIQKAPVKPEPFVEIDERLVEL